MFFSDTQHRQNVKFKQNQREERIKQLPQYNKPLTEEEKRIINLDVAELVKNVKAKELKPRELLLAFGKQALIAHKKTNCLTEIMIKDAETWADKANVNGPLAGIPISLKDPFAVKGYDALAGYSRLVNQPHLDDGAVVKLLKDAGGVPFVKTNIPVTMMTIEGQNDIWGRTFNWHNPKFSPGGSSSGEGALLAAGGARIGVGSDIGGSVRVPAAWNGITSLKLCSHRWPAFGDITKVGGFEGIPAVTSPMAKTLPDLKYFIESVIGMQPWKYDHTLVPLKWRNVKLPAKPKVGVLTFPEFLPPTPAQQRALDTTVNALKKQGCEVTEFTLPSPPEEYEDVILKLVFSDGCRNVKKALLPGESNDPNIARIVKWLQIPRFLRRIWISVLRLFGYKDRSHHLELAQESSAYEYIAYTAHREKLRRELHRKWNEAGIDFLITPPHPSPALPIFTPDSTRTVLYTILFNLVDFPAGILPIGRVDAKLDRIPDSLDLAKLEKSARVSFQSYDAVKMAGLPTAVQIVCKRYEDEKTLKSMEFIQDALHKAGIFYK